MALKTTHCVTKLLIQNDVKNCAGFLWRTNPFLCASSVFVHWVCPEGAHSDQHCTNSLPTPRIETYRLYFSNFHVSHFIIFKSSAGNLKGLLYLCEGLHGERPLSHQLLPAGQGGEDGEEVIPQFSADINVQVPLNPGNYQSLYRNKQQTTKWHSGSGCKIKTTYLNMHSYSKQCRCNSVPGPCLFLATGKRTKHQLYGYVPEKWALPACLTVYCSSCLEAWWTEVFS